MAFSRKRGWEVDLLIKTASEQQPLEAESFVLRSLCHNAAGLPADAQEWDVSGLLLDGQPFSQATVSCWLACNYASIHGEGELQPQHISQLSTVTGLTQVLPFADAVGSYAAVCRAACSQLQQLKFVVQLPEQTLEFTMADGYYFHLPNNQVLRASLGDTGITGAPLASVEQRHSMQQQVAKETAALLRFAHTLRLQPLLDVLHQFILLNGMPAGERLLSGVMGLVFSDAVLEAAGAGSGSSALSKDAYVSSVLTKPCSLMRHAGHVGQQPLLKPVNLSAGVLKFDVVLLRDFAGGRAGETVEAKLDLFGSATSAAHLQLRAGEMRTVVLPAQLLLGFFVPDAAALERLLELDADGSE